MSFLEEILNESSKKEKKDPVKLPEIPVKDDKPKTAPSTEDQQPEGGAEWGYDLYPERRKEKNTSVMSNLMQGRGRENIDKIRCERNVYKCVKTSPLVRLMMSALKSSGCAIDIRRHIACEECSQIVSGGYDPVLNQVVICQNVAKREGPVQSVLTHEMIHMFDYCRNKLDFKNLDHLACTEVRAANLAHCSFVSAWLGGDASVFNIKESHQVCVKNKAMLSVMAVRNVTKEEAFAAVERVFPKCYADLEPIGRRIKRNSTDMYKAQAEGYLYGYDPDI